MSRMVSDVTLSMPVPPAGPVPARMIFRTRCGSSCAITCEMKPPREKPSRSTCARPRARMKATASRAIASTDVGVLPSDAPMPWLSKTGEREGEQHLYGAVADLVVDGVDAGGAHAHEQIARARFGPRQLHHF